MIYHLKAITSREKLSKPEVTMLPLPKLAVVKYLIKGGTKIKEQSLTI